MTARRGVREAVIADPFPTRRRPGAALAFGYSPLLETVLSLHVLVRAEAPRAPARLGARDARRCRRRCKREIARSRSSTAGRSRTACSPSDDGVRGLRGRAGAARARLGPTSRRSSSCGRSTTTAAGRDGEARARRPARPGDGADARRASGVGARGARPRSSSTTPPRSSSASPRCSRRYWEEAFAAEWERIEPRLAETRRRRRPARSRATASSRSCVGARAAAPRRRRTAASFGLDIPHDHEVDVDRPSPAPAHPERLRLAARPRELRPALAADARLPRAVPARESLRHARRPSCVRVVARARRRHAAADPASRSPSGRARTQELAPLVGPERGRHVEESAPARRGGRRRARREGYYVVYSLVGDRIESLAGDLRHVLAPSPPA